MSGRKDHIPQLDGLRGLACLLVLAQHANAEFGLPFACFGTQGVYLFFALSGFLITRNLLASNDGPGKVGAFYLRRAARLLPVFMPTVAVVAWVCRSSQWPWTMGYLTNLIPGHSIKPLAHCWSLCVEEHFYLLWPWVIWFAWPGMSSSKPARFAAWSLVLLTPALAVVVAKIYGPGLARPSDVAAQAYGHTLTNLLPLAVGAGLACDEAWWRAGRRLLWLAGAMAAGWVLWPYAVRWTACVLPAGGATEYAMAHIGMQLLCCAAFCVALADRYEPLGLFLVNAPMRYVGKISYGLYVYHFPIFLAVVAVRQNRLTGLLALAISFGVAAASYRYYERPIMDWARGVRRHSIQGGQPRATFGRPEQLRWRSAPQIS